MLFLSQRHKHCWLRGKHCQCMFSQTWNQITVSLHPCKYMEWKPGCNVFCSLYQQAGISLSYKGNLSVHLLQYTKSENNCYHCEQMHHKCRYCSALSTPFWCLSSCNVRITRSFENMRSLRSLSFLTLCGNYHNAIFTCEYYQKGYVEDWAQAHVLHTVQKDGVSLKSCPPEQLLCNMCLHVAMSKIGMCWSTTCWNEWSQ